MKFSCKLMIRLTKLICMYMKWTFLGDFFFNWKSKLYGNWKSFSFASKCGAAQKKSLFIRSLFWRKAIRLFDKLHFYVFIFNCILITSCLVLSLSLNSLNPCYGAINFLTITTTSCFPWAISIENCLIKLKRIVKSEFPQY